MVTNIADFYYYLNTYASTFTVELKQRRCWATTARNRCAEPMPGGGQQRQRRHSRDPHSRELGSDELGSCGAKEHSRQFGSWEARWEARSEELRGFGAPERGSRQALQ